MICPQMLHGFLTGRIAVRSFLCQSEYKNYKKEYVPLDFFLQNLRHINYD